MERLTAKWNDLKKSKKGMVYGYCSHCGCFGRETWKACPYCTAIMENACRLKNKKIKVRVIETGIIYETMTACAKDIFVDRCSISHALQTGKPCCGYHIERIES